jgi:UDP:flavonoid glycosyltransferase YjiC (YdhE family)
MKILLAPYGTRGDVQPLIALGIALRNRGHRVEVSAPDNFRAWVQSFGLVFHPVGLDMEQLLCAAGDKIRSLTWMMKHLSQDLIPAQFNSLPQTFPDADIIVGAGLQFAGASVAEHRGVPYVMVAYCPVAFPSSQHPAPNIKSQRLPGVLNRLTWALGAVCADLLLRASMNRSRGRLGLGRIAGAASHLITGDHTILATDPSLAPAPRDLRAGIVRVDSLVLEEGGSLDDELTEFLSAGAPPIYVGFGSMVTDGSDGAARVALEAAQSAGSRLLLGSGWTGLGLRRTSLPPWCRVVATVPHHLLFPRCAAVVHHGGAGTSTTVARAGVPQIVVPHLLDQFYWAHRVQLLGLGPKSVRFDRLQSEGLALNMKAVLDDPSFRQRASSLGDEIRKREGMSGAVRMIEELGSRI